MNEQRLLELQHSTVTKLQDAACEPIEILLEFSREMAASNADFCATLYLPNYEANPEQAETLIEASFENLADRLGGATRDICRAAEISPDHLVRLVRTAARHAFWGRLHAISNAMASADVGSVH